MLHVHYLTLQIRRPCRGEFLVYPCLLPPVKKSTYTHMWEQNTTWMRTKSVSASVTLIYLEGRSLKWKNWITGNLSRLSQSCWSSTDLGHYRWDLKPIWVTAGKKDLAERAAPIAWVPGETRRISVGFFLWGRESWFLYNKDNLVQFCPMRQSFTLVIPSYLTPKLLLNFLHHSPWQTQSSWVPPPHSEPAAPGLVKPMPSEGTVL